MVSLDRSREEQPPLRVPLRNKENSFSSSDVFHFDGLVAMVDKKQKKNINELLVCFVRRELSVLLLVVKQRFSFSLGSKKDLAPAAHLLPAAP